MELALLGTGTCAPSPSRTPACYFLSAGPSRFLIDPGPGALGRMAAAGIDPFSVEAIVITHHHLDHCSDLMPYLFSYKNCQPAAQKRGVKIIAPEGFKVVYEKLLEVYGQWILSDDYDVKIVEMWETSLEIPGGSIRSLPVAHGANALGYRFEKDGGPVFAYSGDTGYCGEIVELAREADLLLIECSSPDGRGMEGHLTPSEAARVGAESSAKKMALTHFYPEVDTAIAADAVRAAGYEGEIVVGEDGMRLTVR
ncbi:MAG: MBL fold metallo-hydrolase [Candidatus Nitrospinota bacterium M3_3B_026]